MKTTIAFLVFSFFTFFTSCDKKKKEPSRLNEYPTVSVEEANKILSDKTSIDTTELTNHDLIAPENNLFNEKEANESLKKLIKRLVQSRLIDNINLGNKTIKVNSYDATDKCYKFFQIGSTNDPNKEFIVVGWWNYYPTTNKIINGITFEELK
jgi:hypothetical protein